MFLLTWFHLKFFIYEKNVAFISPGRKCEDGIICFWFSQPGYAAVLPLLVCLVATGVFESDFKTSITQICEGDFIFSLKSFHLRKAETFFCAHFIPLLTID
jgi:hypothetical protein